MPNSTYTISISTTSGGSSFFLGTIVVNNSNNGILHFYNNTPGADSSVDILVPTSGSSLTPDNSFNSIQQPFTTNGTTILNPGTFPFNGGFINSRIVKLECPSAGTGLVTDGGAQLAIISFAVTLQQPPCFLKGSKILTNRGYLPVEQLRPGDLVKTVEDDYKRIELIGYSQIHNPGTTERIKNRLYRCSKSQYPSLFEDLIITGCHSILVDNFKEGEREKAQEVLGKIYVTDRKYRLPACVDQRASTYEVEGDFTIYHLALENEDYYMNYGIYANGLLVETCSRRYLKEISNMTLVQK